MIIATCWPRRSLRLSEHVGPIQKPSLPVITYTSTLADFVRFRLTLIFNILEIYGSFLAESDWKCRPEYEAAKAALKRLSPLNDSTERAIALAIKFNKNITRDEESFHDLVLVVKAHRKQYGLKNRTDLKCL